MNDRANGWLLIVGGLAIGLVLWLSPPQSKPSWSLVSRTRHHVKEVVRGCVMQSQPV